jgi:hypothetical protein
MGKVEPAQCEQRKETMRVRHREVQDRRDCSHLNDHRKGIQTDHAVKPDLSMNREAYSCSW